MSIANALSNAVSGLTASSRGTETVAANLANAMTPSYARRETMLSAQTLGGSTGGVRVDGIRRNVNDGLVAEGRLADAAMAETTTQLTFFTRIEGITGLPGTPGGLSTRLTDFRTSLQSAASRPDEPIRLSQVVDTADKLADALNFASAEVQKARTDADRAIAQDVVTLTTGLDRVAALNKRITVVEAEGGDTGALRDQRQLVVDSIARIVPLQEVARDSGKIALFTMQGAVLLDGTRPVQIGFRSVGEITPEMQADSGALNFLTYNGVGMTAGQMRLFNGGALAANFAIRDTLAPQVQAELDGLAYDLHARLADPAVDASLTAGDAGVFADKGMAVDAASFLGLSARLNVNPALIPSSGGEIWRIRDGIGATAEGSVGDATLLNAISAAMNTTSPGASIGPLTGAATASDRFAQIEAAVATRRVNAEGDTSVRGARVETIRSGLAVNAVDSDAEMQLLLQFEQTYAANARVIQAIQDMMDQILRLT